MDKLTVRDFDPAGKRVLVRVDFNVPIEDGQVKDDTRIRAAIPTIDVPAKRGAIVILMSHLGRPNGKVVESARLRPVAERLSQLLRIRCPAPAMRWASGTEDALGRMKPGQVLLLENLRFHAAEEANDPAFAEALAAYGTSTSTTRSAPPIARMPRPWVSAKFLPAYAGLLMEQEIANLSGSWSHPSDPFAAVIGGAKVTGKIAVLEHLMDRVDTFVIGGGMANTFLVARATSVGKSLLEKDRVDDAKRILETAEAEGRGHPAADRHRGRQGGHPRRRAQDRARPQDPQQLVRGGRRPGQSVAPSRRPWSRPGRSSGTARWACSRCPRSATARAPWPASWPQARRGGRRGRRRRRRLGRCRRGAQARRHVHPRLHRRRRQPRVPRGQGAAGHRGAPGSAVAGSRPASAQAGRQQQ